ncbi:unnamed protein product [Camellia sinensis]
MTSPNSFLPTLLILALYYFVCSHHHVVVAQNTRFQVHVISEVPDTPSPLKIHCKSRDNDLGLQLMKNGQDFHWSFREISWELLSTTAGSGGMPKSKALMFSPVPSKTIVNDKRSRGFVSGQ